MTTTSFSGDGTFGRRSAFRSLRKAPSALFRSEKANDHNGATLSAAGTGKKQRRKGLSGLWSRGKPDTAHAPPVPKLPTQQLSPSYTTVQPENKQRPSCGPDPFSRPTREGARVVHHAFSPPRQQPSAHELASTRHASAAASYCDSGVTTSPTPSLSGIHVVSIDDIDDLDDPLMELNEISSHPRSSPVVCWDELPPSSLPKRHASLGRVLDTPKLLALAEEDEPVEPSSSSATVAKRPLDRTKTRSRVWGVLSSKLRPKKAGSAKGSTMTTANPVLGNVALQPKTPVIHVSHPSDDNNFPTTVSNCHNVVNDPDSPFISRAPVPHGSKLLEAMMEATQSPSTEDAKATSRKSLPKRKSLVGLFGVAIQKSMDRLRAGVPTPTPRDMPATPPMLAMALEDDISPDMRAFTSRHGNTGFNAYGTLNHPDDDIASANEQLNHMVAHMDVSPSMRKSAGCDAKTPSPLRPRRSGLLVPRHRSPAKGASVSRTPGSPSKRLVASIGKAFHSDNKNATPLKSTPVKSMVKGIRNMFAISPGRLAVPTQVSQTRPDSVATDMSDADGLSVDDFEVDGEFVSNTRSGLDVPRDQHWQSNQASPRPFGSKPPTIPLELDSPSRASSLFHDMFPQYGSKLSAGSVACMGERNMARETFDFAQAIAALKADAEILADDDTLHVARTIEFSTESPSKALSQLEEVLQSRKNSFENLAAASSSSQRRSNPPFQGGVAFQRHIAQTRAPPGPPPPFALPPTPRQFTSHGHHREMSAGSFASISSLGALLPNIDRGNARYIDQAFGFRSRPSSSGTGFAFPERRHHRRASSGVSIDSVILEEVSFVSSHQSVARSQVTTGRADWAARRRASTDSVDSIVRLGRPGLGDRMFDGRHDSQQSLASPTFGAHLHSDAAEAQEAELSQSRPISTASAGVGSDIDLDGMSIPSEPEADRPPAAETKLSCPDQPNFQRNRPPSLDLSSQDHTPSLTSPTSTATDASSLFTVETIRLSNPPAPVHMRAAHGSITSMVQVQPTIHEETSRSTIEPSDTHTDDAQAASALVHDLNARKWGDLGKLAQSLLDSPADRVNSNHVPRTSAEIEAFLADSQAKYKPLDELPAGHSVHRRQTSIHSIRASTSPYSLAPQPLETRFKSKRGSGGRERPVSALLAEFAREVSPHPVFQDHAALSVRIRVPSDVRRDNLGWRRRRHSDDPLSQAPPVVHLKAASAKPATATRESIPSFIAFPNDPSKALPRDNVPPTRPKSAHSQSSLKYRSSRPSSVVSRPTSSRSLKPAKPPVQKRFHVLVDQNGSPSSARTVNGGVLTSRSDSAESGPLAPQRPNVSKFPALQKHKSSPDVRRGARGDKENAARRVKRPARATAVDAFL